jgi:hypothetical protein
MKLIRYIYPLSGKVVVESMSLQCPVPTESGPGKHKNRIELYNIQGELVCIANDRSKIKLLKLQKGFYLLREMDRTGKVIHCDKIEF